MKKIIVAIDGYSGSGKSTTARAVAAKLGYTYIDSGAMYRAVTLYFQNNYINITNPRSVEAALADIRISFVYNVNNKHNEIYLNGRRVEEEIRQMHIAKRVSEVSTLTPVRQSMVAQQRKIGRKRGIVMDGRDIGTVVFPDAELKIFMTADIKTRAERRQKELLEKDHLVNLDEIMENLKKRDMLDSTREDSPLIQAADAIVLDTTFLTPEEQADKIISLAISKTIENSKKIIKDIDNEIFT